MAGTGTDLDEWQSYSFGLYSSVREKETQVIGLAVNNTEMRAKTQKQRQRMSIRLKVMIDS